MYLPPCSTFFFTGWTVFALTSILCIHYFLLFQVRSALQLSDLSEANVIQPYLLCKVNVFWLVDTVSYASVINWKWLYFWEACIHTFSLFCLVWFSYTKLRRMKFFWQDHNSNPITLGNQFCWEKKPLLFYVFSFFTNNV